MMNNMFKVTIVTVVYNGESTIEETIQSVITQTYDNIEYIIIDGASADNTIKVAEKFKGKISKIISEKDNGIYDAMNKGIHNAGGDYMLFLNSGDVLASNNAIESVFNNVNISDDIIYGNFIAVDRIRNIKGEIAAKPVLNIWSGMIFSHQSVFIKTCLLKNHPFDTSYQIAADYNQIVELYKINSKFLYVPIIISEISIRGVSYSNINTTYERIRILRKNNAKIKYILYQYKNLLIDMVRIVLGEKLSDFIRGIKWSIIYR